MLLSSVTSTYQATMYNVPCTIVQCTMYHCTMYHIPLHHVPCTIVPCPKQPLYHVPSNSVPCTLLYSPILAPLLCVTSTNQAVCNVVVSVQCNALYNTSLHTKHTVIHAALLIKVPQCIAQHRSVYIKV